MTWCYADDGEDSSTVHEQQSNVQHIPVSGGAFAALFGDSSVMTWSDVDDGSDSSDVRNR